MRFTLLMALLLMTSCASRPSRSVKETSSPKSNSRTTSRTLPKTVKVDPEQRDWQREQNLVLNKKHSESQFARVNPQNKKITLQLRSPLIANATERQLLEELKASYERNDEIGFQARYQGLLTKYPKSAQIQEAHYMAGLLALSNKNYGPALKSFDLVMKKNPRSATATKALFAKAITYKRMNLRAPSEALLRQVQQKYPQSIEAKRAQLELQIMTQEKKAR